MNENFKDKSDAELVKIINTPLPTPMKSAASIELHERQRKLDQSTNKMTFWILIFTAILVILTFFIIYLEFRTSIETKPKQSTAIEPLMPEHNTSQSSQNPKNNDYGKDH